MSVNCCFLPNSLCGTSISLFNPKNKKLNLGLIHFPLKSTSSTFKCQLHVGVEDIVTITQNKVLIAAGVSAAVGQLAKPLTSVLLYGKSFDLKAVIQAGGFPSTHSSAVTAAATCLALERGFSDSIFGMSVVYALLVMYDAQGVRREVGIHAKTLNRWILDRQMKSAMKTDENTIDTVPEKSSVRSLKGSSFIEQPNSFAKEQSVATQVLKSTRQQRTTERDDEFERIPSYVALKESIGHTEVEVIAGALLGFLVSLSVYAVM
ncbi:putative membrane protein YuiD [Bienertia sinuspersici]